MAHNRVAAPRSAASGHGVGNEGDSYVAGIARVCTHQRASSGSKALQNERGPKLAALAQAGASGMQLWQMVYRMAARATALCLLVISASHVSLLAHPSHHPMHPHHSHSRVTV